LRTSNHIEIAPERGRLVRSARCAAVAIGCLGIVVLAPRCANSQAVPTPTVVPASVPSGTADQAGAPMDTCVECHKDLPDQLGEPVKAMAHDTHAEKGVSCADCHGGDPTVMDLVAMDPSKGFRGKPTHEQVPTFCGRCHADESYMRRYNPKLPTDQLSQYWTSVHGQRLKTGDQKVATCVSCHGAHGILPPDHSDSTVFPANVAETCAHCHSNPQYMATYKIPTDQEQKWKKSVHAELLLVQRDFSAPTCNDCHGNHGAYPPGVNSIAEVCGQCHVNNAAYFLKSPHNAAFDRLGLPQCVTCHSNHEIERASDAMLGGAEGTTCRRCHQPGSTGYQGAVEMRDAIARLQTVTSDTEAMLNRASELGMEVSDEQYIVHQEVRPALIKVRTETHLADPQAVAKTVAAAIKTADKTEASAKSTLREAWNRRRNLLIPLALIILLMVLLYLKLRQLERRA
jgi:hypothetical protein